MSSVTAVSATSFLPLNQANPNLIDHLLDRVLELLGKEIIKQDPNLYQILKKKAKLLVPLNLSDPLSASEQEFYNCTLMLLDKTGKIRSFILNKLQQIHAKQIGPEAIFPSVCESNQPSTVLPAIAFGKAKWATYFGDIGKEPPLPDNIHEILAGPCPIWEGKTVQETHVLVLIPATIDGESLTLAALAKLIQNPKQGPAIKFEVFPEDEYQDIAVNHSYWTLMSRDIVEESRGKHRDALPSLVMDIAQRTNTPYVFPKVLETSICIFMHHVSTEERLYSDSPSTYTLCQSFPGKERECLSVVGGFAKSGFYARYHYADALSNDPDFRVGVGLLRQFITPTAVSSIPKAIPSTAFGKAKWAIHFGDIGKEPPLPDNIHEILERPCSLFPGKKIKETHLLVLIPATVNGCPFTLNSLGTLIQEPKKGPRTHYTDCDFLIRDYRDLPVQRSYWVLMSRDVVHGSKYNTYQAHNQIVANLAHNTGIPYTVPKVLEATTCILMHHVMTEERLYTDDPANTHQQTYTRCQEFSNQEQEWTFAVGNFSEKSFCIGNSFYSVYDGVGVIWSFEPINLTPIPAPALLALPSVTTSIISQPDLNTIPTCAFGRVKWAIHFGDIGEEPPLPDNIHEILAGPCPIWEGKTVQETHALVLIPATIDGRPLTLTVLNELIQKPKQGFATQFIVLRPGEYQDAPVSESHWILMTREILEGSRYKDYKINSQQVADLAQKTGLSYVTPKLLEATICILMHHVSTGEKLYVYDPRTYTRCQEFANNEKQWTMAAGGFGEEGFCISYCDSDGVHIGTGASLELGN